MSTMKMNNWISAIAALVLAYAAGADWRGEMPGNVAALRPNERTASVYHSYEFEPIADDRIAADLRFGHDSGLWLGFWNWRGRATA